MLQDPDDGAGRGEAEEPPRQSLHLIPAALRLSSRAVYRDPAQLASQLLGRLESCKSTSVHRLLSGARAWKGASWLRPITSSLIPPHGPVAEMPEDQPSHGKLRTFGDSPVLDMRSSTGKVLACQGARLWNPVGFEASTLRTH